MTDQALTKINSPVEMMRKPASFIFGGVTLIAILFTKPPNLGSGWREALEWVGFLLLIVAALGRVWATAYVAGRKTKELCQTGPYSITRNPLYLFSFFGAVGFGFAIQNLIVTAFIAFAFLTYYAAVIRSEERRLKAVHGSNFDAYCARVPRFWPRLAKPQHAEVIALNLGPFTRGLREIFWFLAAIVIADVIEWLLIANFWPTIALPF